MFEDTFTAGRIPMSSKSTDSRRRDFSKNCSSVDTKFLFMFLKIHIIFITCQLTWMALLVTSISRQVSKAPTRQHLLSHAAIFDPNTWWMDMFILLDVSSKNTCLNKQSSMQRLLRWFLIRNKISIGDDEIDKCVRFWIFPSANVAIRLLLK